MQSQPPSRASVELDATDHQVLRELQRDARLTWADLGRRVALTAPAARERVRRLESAGIITGYHANVDLGRLGLGIVAFVRVAVGSRTSQDRLIAFAEAAPEVLECHALTGEDSFLLKVQVATMQDLDRLTGSLAVHGRTTTSIVLSTPLDGQVVETPA